jgi:6-pyruvoyltetrahydropterin/6-carboxytetrahydropterin synthase
MSSYESGKIYTHAEGLSCAFRQHKATSHCRHIHGYALQVEITFGCAKLDENGWVQDFGDLKWLKEYLHDKFDHVLIIAQDDPMIESLVPILQILDAARIRIAKATGCEAFAREIYDHIYTTFLLIKTARRYVKSVTVREHAGNFATYTGYS